jgi:hypothetical protein
MMWDFGIKVKKILRKRFLAIRIFRRKIQRADFVKPSYSSLPVDVYQYNDYNYRISAECECSKKTNRRVIKPENSQGGANT